MSVDTEDSSYLGFALKLGHSKALRSLRMCVYIYARFWSGSSERIIWPHRQALLQFSLAGVQAGVYLSIPLGQHWCVRLKSLKPRVLFKTLLWERGSWLSTKERPPAVQHLTRGKLQPFILKEEEFLLVELSRTHTYFLLIVRSPSFHVALWKTNTRIRTLIPTFCPVDSALSPCSLPHSCPLLPPPPLLPLQGLLASAPDF